VRKRDYAISMLTPGSGCVASSSKGLEFATLRRRQKPLVVVQGKTGQSGQLPLLNRGRLGWID